MTFGLCELLIPTLGGLGAAATLGGSHCPTMIAYVVIAWRHIQAMDAGAVVKSHRNGGQ